MSKVKKQINKGWFGKVTPIKKNTKQKEIKTYLEGCGLCGEVKECYRFLVLPFHSFIQLYTTRCKECNQAHKIKEEKIGKELEKKKAKRIKDWIKQRDKLLGVKK